MTKMVVIEHRDGRRYAVTPADFHHARTGAGGETYEEQGFRIQRYLDGSAYEPPQRAAAADEEKPRAKGKD